MSAHDWRDGIGDLCVADYLAEFNEVHLSRHYTPNPGCSVLFLYSICAAFNCGKAATAARRSSRLKSQKTKRLAVSTVDPPGAELLAWPKIRQAKRETVSRDLALRSPYQPTCRRLV